MVQIALALWVLLEVLRKAWFSSEPMSSLMMAVGLVALAANWLCLSLIAKHQNDGVHMRASYLFSKNDVIANLGVVLAGALVWLTGSRYPDLLIGFTIAWVVLRGGLRILREAAQEQRAVSASSANSGMSTKQTDCCAGVDSSDMLSVNRSTQVSCCTSTCSESKSLPSK